MNPGFFKTSQSVLIILLSAKVMEMSTLFKNVLKERSEALITFSPH
jgi:hypothetical protein